MINKARLAASSIIVAGAALIGATAGWDAAPVTISFPSEHTAICGGAFAAILAAVACNFARERAEARAQVFESLLRLEEKRRRYGWKDLSRSKATPTAAPVAASRRWTTWIDGSRLKAMQALAWVRREHHARGAASLEVRPSERSQLP